MRWAPLNRERWRVRFNETTWELHSTKKGAKYPWLLTDGETEQDIGDKTIEAAQAKAEFWLKLSALLPETDHELAHR